MVWQAIIQSDPYKLNTGQLVVEVVFTDGIERKESRVVNLSSSDETQFKLQIRAILSELEASDSMGVKIVKGLYDPSLPPLTREQQERIDFRNSVFALFQMKRAIDAGAMKNDDPAYVAQLSLVSSNFKLSYLDLF